MIQLRVSLTSTPLTHIDVYVHVFQPFSYVHVWIDYEKSLRNYIIAYSRVRLQQLWLEACIHENQCMSRCSKPSKKGYNVEKLEGMDHDASKLYVWTIRPPLLGFWVAIYDWRD